MFKVGRVSHFFDKIGVAIIDLDGTLSVGDKIKFVRGGEDMFEQSVDSLQIEHKKVETAGKGETVGLKTTKDVKEGAEVYRL